MNKKTTPEAQPEKSWPDAKTAKHGNKMVEVRNRFWTDKIAFEDGMIIPKHCWDNGVVLMDSNKDHGISPENPRPFNSILELPATLAKVLEEHGVKLHPNNKLRKILFP